MRLDFDQIFDDYIAANQKVWGHDRALTVGASEAFNCLRMTWFVKRGAEFDFVKDDRDESWGAMERGNLIEDHFVVPAVLGHLPAPAELIGAGDDQETIIQGKSSATPDGLIINLESDALANYGIEDIESEEILFEIKSIDPRANLAHEKAVHHGQVQVQLGIIREETDFNPVYALILYFDASFLDHKTPFVVKFNENMWETSKKRASAIYNVNNPADIPPEGKLERACRYCKWTGACTAVQRESIPEDNSIFKDHTTDAMDKAVWDYQAKKRAADDATKKLEMSKQTMKDILRDEKTRAMACADYRVAWSPVKGKRTLSKKLMEEDGLDPEDYMNQGAGHERINVTFKDYIPEE